MSRAESKLKKKAVSTFIAALLLIMLVVVAGVVIYAYTMGYLGGATAKINTGILQVQSVAEVGPPYELYIYVKNIGSGLVKLDPAMPGIMLYADGKLLDRSIIPWTITVPELAEGETGRVTIPLNDLNWNQRTITFKLVTLDGIFTQTSTKITGTGGGGTAPVLNRFTFDTISSPKTSGTPFSITIRAIDQYGAALTTYTGTAALSVSGGLTINPLTTTGGFTSGLWTGSVTLTGTGSGVTITATDVTPTGTSNPFTVSLPALGSIRVVKDAQPNNAQSFGFTDTGLAPTSFSLVDNGGVNYRDFTGLAAGTYRITETNPSSPWFFDSITINDPNGGSSSSSRTATVAISAGESVTVTFKNIFRGDRTFTASYDGTTRYYWLDLPDHFDSTAPTPLIIFLHGYGQDRNMWQTYFSAFRQLLHQNGWMVACAECRVVGGYSTWYTAPSRSDITDVINLLEQEFNIDRSHIHIMGTSMGGSGTLKYAMFNPDIIASACDIMGVTDFAGFYYWTSDSTLRNSIAAAYGGTPSAVPQVYANESPLGNEIRFIHTPVFLLHGSIDTVVPVSDSRRLYNSLTQAGYDVTYVEVPNVGHYATTLVEGREQIIFDWFMSHPLYTGVSP